MKFLVFTTDVVPVAGLPTSGTALRTHGLIEGLRSHGHHVEVSIPASALRSAEKIAADTDYQDSAKQQLDSYRALSFDAINQPGIISQTSPDVIVCGHWPALTHSARPSQPVVIDLAGPHMLERHYQNCGNQSSAVLAKLGVLSKANYYIASGPTQRLYFLSYLLRAGVPQPERRMVEMTMPLDPNLPPERASLSKEFPHFLFGGVFLPWQDPSFALNQLAGILREKGRGRLSMIGGEHPSYKLKQGVYADLFQRFREHPQISSSPMLPYFRFVERLAECDVAVDLMKWNLERQLAVTIRSTSFLWAGVPIIYNNFADISRLIQRYDAGWCIEPHNEQAFRSVCEQIYNDPDLVLAKSRNARRLAQEVFAWDRAVLPLLDILGTAESKPAREVDITLDFPENAQYRVTKKSPVAQYFICRLEGLAKVEFRLATHERTIQSPLRVVLQETGGANPGSVPTGPIIARKELLPHQIENNEWHTVEIPALLGSAGKTFVLRLETDEDNEEYSVSPWAVRGDPYPLLGMYHGPQKVRGTSLCFRTTCAAN